MMGPNLKTSLLAGGRYSSVWPIGWVCSNHPTVPGLNPKHTIYAFSIFCQILYYIFHLGEKMTKINKNDWRKKFVSTQAQCQFFNLNAFLTWPEPFSLSHVLHEQVNPEKRKITGRDLNCQPHKRGASDLPPIRFFSFKMHFCFDTAETCPRRYRNFNNSKKILCSKIFKLFLVIDQFLSWRFAAAAKFLIYVLSWTQKYEKNNPTFLVSVSIKECVMLPSPSVTRKNHQISIKVAQK